MPAEHKLPSSQADNAGSVRIPRGYFGVSIQEVAVPGIQIGQLLVEQGVLSELQVQRILHEQKKTHRPFGDLAERLYGISPKAVEDAWIEQYLRTVGVVDLNRVDLDVECLRVLNRRQAWQFHMLPMYRQDVHLNVATSAENLVRSVNFSARRIDEPVYIQIAERQQLREFLMKHYPVPSFLAQAAERL
ncbi:MAG TPA: hypothetical protein VHY37_02605 [Tepidisphaeraceae bacterium]|nr:hypothetical protein [Tepidisphaeraceae bacterium]